MGPSPRDRPRHRGRLAREPGEREPPVAAPAAWAHLFTVFTATYNRAHTLPRVYRSLSAQTCRDFEWLVVDDGSTDDTAALVQGWAAAADFPVRYVRQEHRGKPAALNRGVREARGELFLVLDSDDACSPEALARFRHHWLAIPEPERARFSAVTALCVDQRGALVGTEFPRDVLDSDPLEIRYRYRVRGEKWGFQRTGLLRAHPFPEAEDGTYVPEGLVWRQIARGFRTRFVNERLRTYWIEGPSLVHGRPAGAHALGGHLEHLAVLNEDRAWFRWAPAEFVRSAVHYARFSAHLGLGPRAQWRRLAPGLARVLWLALAPVGWAVWLRDRGRAGRR